MYLILFFLILLLLLLYFGYLLSEPVAVSFLLDTDDSDMHLDLKWPYPLEAKVKMVDYHPFLSIFLFHKRIYAKAIRQNGAPKGNFLKYYPFLNYRKPDAQIFYSFDDPFQTGLANGALEILDPFFNNATIEQYPDYMPDHAYLVIQANTELFPRESIVKILKTKFKLKR